MEIGLIFVGVRVFFVVLFSHTRTKKNWCVCEFSLEVFARPPIYIYLFYCWDASFFLINFENTHERTSIWCVCEFFLGTSLSHTEIMLCVWNFFFFAHTRTKIYLVCANFVLGKKLSHTQIMLCVWIFFFFAYTRTKIYLVCVRIFFLEKVCHTPKLCCVCDYFWGCVRKYIWCVCEKKSWKKFVAHGNYVVYDISPFGHGM